MKADEKAEVGLKEGHPRLFCNTDRFLLLFTIQSVYTVYDDLEDE